MPISECRSPITMLTDAILITILIMIAVEDNKEKLSFSPRYIQLSDINGERDYSRKIPAF